MRSALLDLALFALVVTVWAIVGYAAMLAVR